MNLSTQTQAIILLTVALGKSDAKPLSIREWARFAPWLKDHQLDPSQLLKGDLNSLLASWMDKTITVARIEGLLDRGGALGIALEKWQRAGLWIVARSEADYPDRLKKKLRLNSPPVLFGAGNKSLLGKGGIAVVGSRNANEDDLIFSTHVARSAADQGFSVVSGAARGVDETAMLGALGSEGTAVGIMADSLLRAATSAKYRKHLLSGDLVLVSPFNPEAGFNVGNAMARNKYIYCLSDAAVVVNSTPDKGGTWNGAIEDIQNEWVPIWVKPNDSPKSGNAALVQKGAQWFPKELPSISELWAQESSGDTEPTDVGLPLLETAAGASAEQEAGYGVEDIFTQQDPSPKTIEEPEPNAATSEADLPEQQAVDFYHFFLKRLLELTCDNPMNADEIAQHLELQKSQVNAWLKRGVEAEDVSKLNRPVRYQSALAQPQQTSFLETD